MTESYIDKSASLIVFGIFEIIGGLLCTMLAAFSLLPLAVSSGEISLQQIATGALVYLFLAVWLIGTGIGTIKGRRWARVLVLAGSWMMLACGILSLGMMIYILPKSYAATDMSTAMIAPILVFTYLILFLLYILLPLIGVIFHSNRKIRATFEQRDPNPSWTEQCPLPIMVLVLILSLSAIYFIPMSIVQMPVPLFGTILTGWMNTIFLLGCFGLFSVLAVASYRRHPVAWWTMLLLLIFGTASQLLTFYRIDLMDLFVEMGYSDQMLLQLQKMEGLNSTAMSCITALYAIPGFIYVLVLKRYFNRKKQTAM